jgi:hypothetical protein
VGSRRPGARQLVDADGLVRADLRPDGRRRELRKLFAGDLAFNDETVKEALREMLKHVNDQYLLGGVDTALSISFQDGIARVFGTNPKAEITCWAGSSAASP